MTFPLKAQQQHQQHSFLRRLQDDKPQGMHFGGGLDNSPYPPTNSSNNNSDVEASSSSSTATAPLLIAVILTSYVLGMLVWWCYQQRRRQNSQEEATVAATDKTPVEATSPPNFEQLLQATSLTVQRQDIQRPHRSSSSGCRRSSNNSVSRRSSSRVQRDVENQPLSEELEDNGEGSSDLFALTPMTESNTKLLKIPISNNNNSDNTVMLVPCVCAICLGSFRPDQTISWSETANVAVVNSNDNKEATAPTEGCVHAFHTQCLVDYCQTSWTLQQQQPPAQPSSDGTATLPKTTAIPCPLCRRPFLTVPPTKDSDKKAARTASTTAATI